MSSTRWTPDCLGPSSTASPNARIGVCQLLRDIMSKALAWQPIPDALQARAVAEWGKDGLVEIVVISGFYQMFAAINRKRPFGPTAWMA